MKDPITEVNFDTYYGLHGQQQKVAKFLAEKYPKVLKEIRKEFGDKKSQSIPEFYEEIGHRGGQRVRRLIQEGKEHEEE